MAELSRQIDMEKLFSFSDDLVKVLKEKRDIDTLTQCIDHSKSLHSSCDADLNQLLSSIQDYQRKIDVCKQKTEQAKSEVAAEAEVDLLQKDLEEEREKERALQEELRVIMNEMNDLEHKRISIEERKHALKKSEKDDLRTEMMLSMYASVTKIIPDLNEQSKVSGYIVDRDKNVVEKFEYDPAKMTDFDICQSIWKAINSS
ncbi:hypothetical protein Q3G72_015472 [Acer saccharum]|nr:hypothetical protein Q3G72_015472 [Acer saccharum]